MFVCLHVCPYLIEAVNDKLAASQQTWARAGGTKLVMMLGECRRTQQKVLRNKSQGMKGLV